MNHCETTRQRRSGACGCSASSLFYLGVLPTVELPETATRQRRAFLNFRQLLVSQRVQLQNHLRSVLVAQGLEAPRGFRAWTAAGLAFFDGLARAPHECAADELWRSELYVSLTLYRGVVVQLNGVEANDPQSVAADSRRPASRRRVQSALRAMPAKGSPRGPLPSSETHHSSPTS